MAIEKYTTPATSLTPALVIYLIDASDSMNELCGVTTKIELVNDALKEAIYYMALKSMRDNRVQPRYKVAIFAYSTKVLDVLQGIRTITELTRVDPPKLTAGGNGTDTAAGFTKVEELLQAHLSDFQQSPAPLVCHLTDALFTTQNPAPIVHRMRAMRVDDGEVLIENVLMEEQMLRKPVKDWHQWGGVDNARKLNDEYAKHLFTLSSPLPETYRRNINSKGYQLQKGAALFFPGTHLELVKLALVAPAATN